MAQHRTHCVPHPNHLTQPVERVAHLPLSIQWRNCEAISFVETLLAPIKKIPGGNLIIAIMPRGLSDKSKERYTLSASPQGIELLASSTTGAIYGAVTILQLHQNEALDSFERIIDQPRFAWRGLLIDPARHFLSIGLLKKVIDGMTLLKMNVLHLHLTDDQAFRFECEAYPKLQSHQHYTQTELRHLVAYGQARGVEIVPELDVPGHVTSWLQAYPEWGCLPVEPTHRFGVHKACLNPTDERVFSALETIFSEVASVFPGEHIHIGGDEVHPAWWSKDPTISSEMVRLGFTDLSSLQNYFTRRVVKLVSSLGRTAIGWDEVLHDDMPEMIVQNWRGMTTRDRIGRKGLKSIVSAPYYLDLHFPADLHYAFDIEADQSDAMALEDAQQEDERLQHVKEGLLWRHHWREQAVEIERATHVLGGEACLWSELVDEHTLETRLWSRLPAVAERLWSDEPHSDFQTRLDALLCSTFFSLEAKQKTALDGLGLDATQVKIALLLEPVKWYARLLGQQALEARISGREMPKARPYRMDTPLNRVVDMISPESRSAVAMRDAPRAKWLELAGILQRQDTSTWPKDLRPVIKAFKHFGEIIVSDDRAAASALYIPHGEYMIAAIPAWLARD